MSWIENRASEHAWASDVRRFGLTLGVILGTIGLWPAVIRGSSVRVWPTTGATLVLVLAVVSPAALGLIYAPWMRLAALIGAAVNGVILAALFYAVIAPVGFIRRRLGLSLVHRSFDPEAASYRVPKAQRDPSHMRHLF